MTPASSPPSSATDSGSSGGTVSGSTGPSDTTTATSTATATGTGSASATATATSTSSAKANTSAKDGRRVRDALPGGYRYAVEGGQTQGHRVFAGTGQQFLDAGPAGVEFVGYGRCQHQPDRHRLGRCGHGID